MTSNWKVYGDDTLAAKLDNAELPGFFRTRATLASNEGAVVYKNGTREEVVTEGKITTENLWQRFKGLFDSEAEVDVVIFTTSPFEGQLFLGLNREVSEAHVDRQALTLDGAQVSAQCEYRLSIKDPDSACPEKLLGQEDALAKWSLCGEVSKLLFAKVMQAKLASVRLDEIRGNAGLAEELEKEARVAVAREYGETGLQLDSLTIIWGLSDEETAALEIRCEEREEEARAFQHQLRLNKEQRALELARTRLVNTQEYNVLKEKGENELAKLHLEGTLEKDLVEKGHKIDVAEVDAQARRIELDIQKYEANVRLETDRAAKIQALDVQERESRQKLAEAESQLKLEQDEIEHMAALQIKMSTEKHLREMEKRRVDLDAEFDRLKLESERRIQELQLQLESAKGRMSSTEGIMKQALDSGAATPEVLKAYLEQNTEQEYATGSDEKVKARAEAAAAKANLDTHRQAQAEAREHQIGMTEQSANLMQASKQNVPQTLVQGGQSSAHISAGQTNSEGVDKFCQSCGKGTPAAAKFCPHCGTALS